MLGTNPVYDAPADAEFATAMKKAKHTIHASLYVDETSKLAEWHIPAAHYLESWGDVRATNGAISMVQPLIAPLYHDAKTDAELLTLFTTGKDDLGYNIVRSTWMETKPDMKVAFTDSTGTKMIASPVFEMFWKKTLHEGLIENSETPSKTIAPNSSAIAAAISAKPFATKAATKDAMEVVFMTTDMHDGRYTNNAWLQEAPEIISKVTWDNAAYISKKTAEELGIKTEFHLSDMNRSVIKLSHKGKDLEAPVWIMPGQADNSITLVLGYGRDAAGNVGNGVGYNATKLRFSDGMDMVSGVTVVKTAKDHLLANTQNHGSMEGRAIVLESPIEKFREEPNTFKEKLPEYPEVQLFTPPQTYEKGHQWGMAIDLNACIGCNACAVACQSENNIPVVGKEQVKNGRVMSWIRIDRYFAGSAEEPEMVFQPVGCQHCENAPCEQVCPVAATVHSEDGLNSMVYNRCVGTRYCANNCPYKVRRFNFFNYGTDNPVWHGDIPETVKMAMNPEVTVRFRGVMEKCTYCVQRIDNTRIAAKVQGKTLVDGDIKSACQQTCPTEAIVFGDINDPNSKVSQMKRQKRNYDLLAELNIKPRTSYLGKLRNPNPELEKATA
jgi:Fe-S-cluster-containing dehydrogenase component